MTKQIITKRLIVYQMIVYGMLLLLIVGDEVFDFPHHLFGAPATPANLYEAFIEGMYVVVLSALSLYLSWHLLTRIKYLEGFVPICAFCKRVHAGNDWKSLEEYIGTHSEAEFSHGLCPECGEKHYGERYRKAMEGRQEDAPPVP